MPEILAYAREVSQHSNRDPHEKRKSPCEGRNVTYVTGGTYRGCTHSHHHRKQAASKQLLQGLTQEISNTLKNNYLSMTGREVMADMAKRGFDFKTYSNPLASVHTVLKRLVKAGKVKVVPREKGKKEYQWERSILDVLETLKNLGEVKLPK